MRKYIILLFLLLVASGYFYKLDNNFNLPPFAYEIILKRKPGKYTFWLGGNQFAQISFHDPSQGPRSPTSAASVAGVGTIVWTNPTNAEAQDSVFATATTAATTWTSRYLETTGYGFSVPAGNTINGIQVDIWGKGDVFNAVNCCCTQDKAVMLLKASTLVGSNLATTGSGGNPWPTTNTDSAYGGSTNLWGTTWSVSDVNGSGFGAAFSVNYASAGFC